MENNEQSAVPNKIIARFCRLVDVRRLAGGVKNSDFDGIFSYKNVFSVRLPRVRTTATAYGARRTDKSKRLPRSEAFAFLLWSHARNNKTERRYDSIIKHRYDSISSYGFQCTIVR